MLLNPCFDNLHPLKELDDFLDDLLKDKRKVELEYILRRVQKKNRETMSPIARLWVTFDQATKFTQMMLRVYRGTP